MKRILTYIICSVLLLGACIVVWNTTHSHLKFMGIPIDGTIEEFSKKLEEKGLKEVGDSQAYDGNRERRFSGTFSSENYGSEIVVYYDERTHIVYEIVVHPYGVYYKEDIDELLNNYKKKYGKLNRSSELEYDYCIDVKALWSSIGTIRFEFRDKVYPYITYTDRINEKKHKESLEAKVLDDL